ncbi:MAG: hypothetical protein ACTSYD_08680 [Candidatus Heimdallarchaeaceae archaeon]
MVKIGISTSRSPAKKTRSFVRDFVFVIPNAVRFPRGTANIPYILSSMKSDGCGIGVIIHSVKGNPNFFRIFDLSSGIKEMPYAIKLYGYSLEREYSKKKVTKRRPAYAILISSIGNKEHEKLLKQIFNVSEISVKNLKNKPYVTVYIDYLYPEDDIIFVEFLNEENISTGPKLKLRIVPRRVENL